MINKQNTEETEVETGADDSPVTPAESSSVDEFNAALAAMEQKADEHWQRYLRTAAELENVRKRAVRDVEHAHRFGLEKFAADVLGVRDSMAMGLDASKETDSLDALREGQEMTLKLLDQVLSRHDVTEINPLGEPFDPEFHEAMAVIDAPDAAPNTVVTVVQAGFQISGRLLRAARVIVARAEN